MTVTIQNASRRDIERLYAVEKECFQSEAFSRRQLVQLLSDYDEIALLAKKGDKIVGFIIATIEQARGSLTGHILTIDVLQEHRRQGIGHKLMSETERLLKEKGVRKCYLEVRENNVPALELYERLDYTKVARLGNYYRSANGLYLEKQLA